MSAESRSYKTEFLFVIVEGERSKSNDLDIHFFVILTRADRLGPDVKSGYILDRAYYRSAYLFLSGHFLSDSETFTQPDTAHNAF